MAKIESKVGLPLTPKADSAPPAPAEKHTTRTEAAVMRLLNQISGDHFQAHKSTAAAPQGGAERNQPIPQRNLGFETRADGPTPAPTPGPTPRTRGTETLYPMPDSGPTPIVNAINRATRSVDLSVYLLTDPAVEDSLKQAAARGVKVRVMLEPDPVGGTKGPDPLVQQTMKDLQAAGIQVETTPPQFDSGMNVDHAKFLDVDHKDLLLGTGNLVRSGLGDGVPTTNRDFWLEDTRRESSREAEKLFNDDWNRTSTQGVNFKNLIVSPDNADARILGFIDGAKTRLLVYNQELHDPTVVQHLIAAKQRGVDVEVITASPYGGKGPDSNGPALQQLQAAGIPTKELTSHYLHAKAMVADNEAFIGSQNFSEQALGTATGGVNRELGEIVKDKTVVEQLVQTFKADQAT